MAFDYDLVIIGGTMAAREAARWARSLQARVALVEPESSQQPQAWVQDYGAGRALIDLSGGCGPIPVGFAMANQAEVAEGKEGTENTATGCDWATLRAWAIAALDDWQAERSLLGLATSGVDVVVGDAAFTAGPRLSVVVGDRLLCGRRYLIANRGAWQIPPVAGLEQIAPLTPDTLWSSASLGSIPKRCVVVGDDPVGVEQALGWARLGAAVTLAVNAARILPQEDPEAAALIQAVLVAAGVRVLTQAPLTLVKWLDDGPWMQLGDWAIATDQVIIADQRQPQLDALNLAAANLTLRDGRLSVNRWQQTRHRQIYAIGDAIARTPFAHVAYAEAQVAVSHALLGSRRTVSYHTLPWAIATAPPLARVGLTETQARQTYGDIVTVQQSYKTLACAHLQGDTTGFCKLIARRNGQIVGAHWVGANADEGIGAIAIAMQQRLTLAQLGHSPALSPTYSEIIHHAAQQWQRQRTRQDSFWGNLLEAWFNLRRG